MTKKLLQLYGLKWNPFTPDVPTEPLHVTARLDSFGWRVEQLVREGGFAMILGDPGTGKSVALRLLAARLARDVVVGILTRPHAGLADCYRELGHLFGVSLTPLNRWVRRRSATRGGRTSRRRAFGPYCSWTKRKTSAPRC